MRTPRIETDFSAHWKWVPCDLANGMDARLDERSARTVHLPHTNHIHDLFDLEPDEWRYVSWYRKHVVFPDDWHGCRIRITVHGAGQVNTVYADGKLVGEWRGHFTPCTLDLTDALSGEGPGHVLAIRVDNTEHQELPPTRNDFYFFGGIHRPVTLSVVNPLHVDDTFAWTEKVETGVVLRAAVTLVNDGEGAQDATLAVRLCDAGGQVVANIRETIAVEAGDRTEVPCSLAVEQPRLWTLDDPYLHRLEVELETQNGPGDATSFPVGLRWIGVDAAGTENARVYLNDDPVRLWGLNRHEQFPYIGNAAPERFHRLDARVLKAAGCNVVRTAHYPHNPAFLDECDRIGLLVEGENLGWQSIGDTQWKAAYEEQLQTMIYRDRNHPSVFAWSVCVNEAHDDPQWNRRLHNMAKSLDPTRPTVDETCYRKEMVTDIYSLHDYLGDDVFKHGGDGIVPPYYQPWIVGEVNNVLGANFVLPNDNESRKRRMLEKDALKLDKLWACPKVAGVYRWEAFGFLSPNGRASRAQLRAFNNLGSYRCSGALDSLRNLRWLGCMYAAMGDPDNVGNVLHILNEWKSDSPDAVYVAANCDEVELFCGDQSLGRTGPNAFTALQQGLFLWTEVSFQSDAPLRAVGYRNGERITETTRYPSGYDVTHSVHLEPVTESTIRADGSDMAWLQATARDANGQRAFYEDGNLRVDVQGPAEVVRKHDPLPMTDGYAVFYIRSLRHTPGTVVAQVLADTGFSVDNTATGAGLNQFDFLPREHWSPVEQSEGFGGDATWSNDHRTENDRVTIRFVGVQIRLYGGKRPDYGIAAVSVDGGKESEIDCSCVPERERDGFMLYASPILPYGHHVLQVRVTTTKHAQATGYGFSVDRAKIMTGDYRIVSNPVEITTEDVAEEIAGASAEADVTRHPSTGEGDTVAPEVWRKRDDRDPRVRYFGGWQHRTGVPSCYHETVSTSAEPQAYVEYTFAGTAVRIYGTRGPSCGKADILIDGERRGTVDAYNLLEQNQVVLFYEEGLAAGPHRLTVVVRGEKNDNSEGCEVGVDALDILSG